MSCALGPLSEQPYSSRNCETDRSDYPEMPLARDYTMISSVLLTMEAHCFSGRHVQKRTVFGLFVSKLDFEFE